MNLPARYLVAILLVLAPLAEAQQPRTTVLLDPAHGGTDSGAHLPNNVLEKDQTLAFAARLRAALTAASINAIATRDADPTVPFTTDQRAEIANQRHPTACLVLHFAPTGNGIHIITSALPPADELADPHVIPWDTAQATVLPQSQRLANQIGLALEHSSLPVVLLHASVRPLDNITCPAVAIEIAPLTNPATSPTDAGYQQRIAQSIASGIASWRMRELQAVAAAGDAGK